jgi:hypothetical protein
MSSPSRNAPQCERWSRVRSPACLRSAAQCLHWRWQVSVQRLSRQIALMQVRQQVLTQHDDQCIGTDGKGREGAGGVRAWRLSMRHCTQAMRGLLLCFGVAVTSVPARRKSDATLWNAQTIILRNATSGLARICAVHTQTCAWCAMTSTSIALAQTGKRTLIRCWPVPQAARSWRHLLRRRALLTILLKCCRRAILGLGISAVLMQHLWLRSMTRAAPALRCGVFG